MADEKVKIEFVAFQAPVTAPGVIAGESTLSTNKKAGFNMYLEEIKGGCWLVVETKGRRALIPPMNCRLLLQEAEKPKRSA